MIIFNMKSIRNFILLFLVLFSYCLIMTFTLFFYDYLVALGVNIILVFIALFSLALMIRSENMFTRILEVQLVTVSVVGCLIFMGFNNFEDISIIRYDRYISNNINRNYFIEQAEEYLYRNPEVSKRTTKHFDIKSKEISKMLKSLNKRSNYNDYSFYFSYGNLMKQEIIDYVRLPDE